MLKSFKHFFAPADITHVAHDLYVALVTQARLPFFYRDCEVADTVDGRFDMIVLHLFFVVHRLRREASDEAAELVRLLSETFFSDMDRSLREMGSTDTGVGMRVQNMAKAFYGRLQSYEKTLPYPQEFRQSLIRNAYREKPVSDTSAGALADYALRQVQSLGEQSAADILQGKIYFQATPQ